MDIFGQFSSQKVIYGPYGPYFLSKSSYMDCTDHIFLVESPYMDLTVLEKMFQKKLTILHKCTREGCFSSVSVTWNLAACGEDVSRTSSSRAHTMQDLCAIGSAGEIA